MNRIVAMLHRKLREQNGFISSVYITNIPTYTLRDEVRNEQLHRWFLLDPDIHNLLELLTTHTNLGRLLHRHLRGLGQRSRSNELPETRHCKSPKIEKVSKLTVYWMKPDQKQKMLSERGFFSISARTILHQYEFPKPPKCFGQHPLLRSVLNPMSLR